VFKDRANRQEVQRKLEAKQVTATYSVELDWPALAALIETPYVDPMHVALAIANTLCRGFVPLGGASLLNKLAELDCFSG